jgi:hypothetical protein
VFWCSLRCLSTVESFEAANALGYDFVAVVPPGYDELLEKAGIRSVSEARTAYREAGGERSNLAYGFVAERI